ncbi:MAG: hypothetical protein JW850_20535 [Thermoflexales bacterium]|nr:hypothetical protein [Thermoflexales bacterium]
MKRATRLDAVIKIVFALLLGLGSALGLAWSLVGAWPAAGWGGDDQLAPQQPAAFVEPHIRLEKNASYYGAAGVAITEVTSLFIGADEAWARYQAGELDSIDPPESAWPDIKASSTYNPQFHIYPQQCTYYYGFSTDVPPFDDPRVRAAFSAAIDRQRLVDETAGGDPQPALTLAPPGTFGYVDGYAAGIGHPYSPTLAQRLLAEAGYTTTPITLAYNTAPGHQAVAESLQRMFSETLGISVTLQSMEWRAYLDLLDSGSPEQRPGIFRLGWCADYPDAHNWHHDVVVAGNSRTRYGNQDYIDRVQAAASESDPATRLELYEQAEAYLVMTDTAIAPLYYYANHSLSRPDLARTYRPYGAQHLDEWVLTPTLRPIGVAGGEPATLDPARAEDTASINTVEQLFLGLTDFDAAGNVVPELATSWETSPDGRAYTFTLRGDAFWTDGVTVTAHDVEYGVLRALDPAANSPWASLLDVIENAQDYREGRLGDAGLVGVHALDDTHVRFVLNTPAAYFPAIAGLWFARPQPHWAIEAHGEEWTRPENIVTNGPYRLAAWVQAPELEIYTWSTGGHARPGGVYAYGVYYRNNGPGTAESARIVDKLPSGTSYAGDTSDLPIVQAGQIVTWELGSLAPGAEGIFMVAIDVPAGAITGSGVITANCVSITNTVLGDDPSDNAQCSDAVDVWDDEVELGVDDTWVEPGDPAPGNEFRYVVRWCNHRGAAAGPVWLTDTLPVSTTLLEWRIRSGGPFWSESDASGGQLVLYALSLPGDRCEDLELTLQLDPAAQVGSRLENVVTIATSGDVYAGNDQSVHSDARVGSPRLDLRLEKSVSAAMPVPGGWIEYSFYYENSGNVPAQVWITDTLPAGLAYQHAFWGGNQPGEDTALPEPNQLGQVVAWELGDMPVGGARWFHMQAAISDTLGAGDFVTNCAVLGVGAGGIDDQPANNNTCFSLALNPPGPNLRVSKEHWWNNDGQIGYRIHFENPGNQAINDVWITDTLPAGTAWNNNWTLEFDEARVVSTSLGAQVLAWQLSSLNPGDQGWMSFEANLDAPGARVRWYTNTVEILTPPGDIDPADNAFTDTAFSGGEVDRAELWMNPLGQASSMWGAAIPDVVVTVTTPYTQLSAWADPANDGFWSVDNVGPVYPGDVLTVTAGKGVMPVIFQVPDPFTAEADSQAKTVSGQVGGCANQTVEIHAYWPGGYRELVTEGDGSFTVAYDDLPRGARGYVRYGTWVNYANVIFHRPFQAPDLLVEVNYGHDWVGGRYEAGHTVWITVTESDGATVKATVTVNTPGDRWTSDNGMWQPQRPDIAPGDWVFGLVDNGQTTEVHLGDVGGRVDAAADTISGTISAPWFTQALPIECHAWGSPIWGQPEGPPMKYASVVPNGVDSYTCQWDPLTEWDVEPGMDIGVYYYEPNGNSVINAFWEPAPRLRVDAWAEGSAGQGGNMAFNIVYWNNGDAVAQDVVISATLEGMAYLVDTLGLAPAVSGGTATWQLGSLPPNSSGSFLAFVELTAPEGETVTNTVQIATSSCDSGEPEEKESRWTGQVWANATRLNVDKWAWTDDPAPGVDFVWVVEVCNKGDTASAGLTLTDTLPLSTTLAWWWADYPGWVEESRTEAQLVLSRPSIPSGTCKRVYLRVHVDENAQGGTELVNTATIASPSDLEDKGNTAYHSVWVSPPHTNLYVSKQLHWGQLVPGGEIHYDIHFGNNGNVPVSTLRITDSLPAGATFREFWNFGDGVSVPQPVEVTPDYVVWELDGLDNGTYGDIHIALDIDSGVPDTATLLNRVEISPQADEDSYDDNVGEWVETLHPSGPNLRVTKRHEWRGDGQLWYEIAFKNVGDRPVDEVWITDTLPLFTTWDSWGELDFDNSRLLDFSQGGGVAAWQFSRLYPADNGYLRFKVNLDEPGLLNRWYTNTVEVLSPSGEVDPSDNASTDVAYSGPVNLEVWVQDPQGNSVPARVMVWNDAGANYEQRSPGRLPAQFGTLEPGLYHVQAWPVEPDVWTLANSVEEWIEIGGAPMAFTLSLRYPDVRGVVETPEGNPLPQAYDWQGNPVPHPAHVNVHNEDWSVNLWTTTNVTGEFSLALPPGSYQVVAHPLWSTALTYAKALPQAFGLATGTPRPLDLGYIRLTYPRLVGTVVDPLGNPVSTWVNLWKDDGGYQDGDDTQVWDGGGKPFRFGGMPAGRYFVRADPPADPPDVYGASNVYEFEVLPGSQYSASVTTYPVLTLTLVNFVGELRFPSTSSAACPEGDCPVPHASLRLHTDDWSYQEWAGSGEDGRFIFSGLAAGVTYTLDFFLPDELRADWDPPALDTFNLASAEDRLARLYRLQAVSTAKRVVGQVKYGDGTPVGDADGDGKGDALVYAYQEGSGIRRQSGTATDGRFDFYLRGGRWRLGVEPAQPEVNWYFDPAWEQWIEFAPDEAIEMYDVTLSVARADFYRVSGTVSDPVGSPPPAGSARIELCTETGRCFGAPVAEDGGFELRVPPGLYHAWVWVEPASSLLPPLDNGFAVAVEGDTSLAVRLRAQAERTAGLQGRVIVTPTGQGLAGVEIQAWTDEGDRAGAQTDANGGYAVNLIPGYWRARPVLTPQQQDSYVVLPPEQREGLVRAGETISNVSFYVRRLDAAIYGWVVDEAGQPLSEVEAVVFAERCVDGECQVIREAKVQGGAFTLKVVGGYTYTVGVWLPAGGYIPGPTVPAQVYAGVGQTVADVRLPLLKAGTRIWGELRDGDSGAIVTVEASVYANSPAGLGVEDALWPGKDPYAYNLYVPTPQTEPVTWTLGLWVNPATGYIPDPAHPSYPVVVEPGRETIWQPMTVKKLDTVIRGRVWISATRPARQVWVYARGAAGTEGAGLYFEAQTDASGVYTMPVLPGVYLLSAHLPPGLADTHLPPEPRQWRAVGDNPIDLWFRPKPAAMSLSGALSVSPTASLPAGTSLTVYGWAEDGSRAEVSGTLGGGYRMAVVSGTTWHLWAAYEDPANDAYYTAREVAVEVGDSPLTGVDLLLERRGELPDAICQSVDPARFTRVSLPPQGTLPEPLIEIQAGTFSETVQVCATPLVAVPDGQRLVGFAYEMEARDSAGRLIKANFNKKVRLIFYLDEEAVPEGLDVATLQPAFYSAARGAWVALDDVFVDAEDLFVTGKTNHFSRLGMMSPPAAGQAGPAYELSRVDLSGPLEGAAGVTYTFTATAVYTPGTLVPPLPVTYTWYAAGKLPASHPSSGSVTDTVSLSWAEPGAKLITVTAASGGKIVTGTHTITIAGGGYSVFLPVVVKNL